MRYTTIIDIRDFPELYRNQNLRLLYLHLVLKSGYHDDDRDQVHTSIRRLGYETGLTVSAVRHGLAMLKKFGLMSTNGATILVKKFVMTEEPTKRARTKRDLQEQLIAIERQREQQRQDYDVEQRKKAAQAADTESESYKSIMKKFGLKEQPKKK